MSARHPRLLWITPADGSIEPMLSMLHADPRGVVVLLRRTVSSRALLSEGRALMATGAPLLVSRRVDLALALGARGVHLPERGVTVADARALLGAERWIGVSRHDRRGLLDAASAGADYATLSPFAATPGKAPPLGAAAFAEARAGVPIAVLALGGVDAESAPAALAAGADGLAFIRAGVDLATLRTLAG